MASVGLVVACCCCCVTAAVAAGFATETGDTMVAAAGTDGELVLSVRIGCVGTRGRAAGVMGFGRAYVFFTAAEPPANAAADMGNRPVDVREKSDWPTSVAGRTKPNGNGGGTTDMSGGRLVTGGSGDDSFRGDGLPRLLAVDNATFDVVCGLVTTDGATVAAVTPLPPVVGTGAAVLSARPDLVGKLLVIPAMFSGT